MRERIREIIQANLMLIREKELVTVGFNYDAIDQILTIIEQAVDGEEVENPYEDYAVAYDFDEYTEWCKHHAFNEAIQATKRAIKREIRGKDGQRESS